MHGFTLQTRVQHNLASAGAMRVLHSLKKGQAHCLVVLAFARDLEICLLLEGAGYSSKEQPWKIAQLLEADLEDMVMIVGRFEWVLRRMRLNDTHMLLTQFKKG